jgi:hypothetical protein
MTYQTNHLKLPILSILGVLCGRSLSRTQPILEQVEGIRDGMKKRNEPKIQARSVSDGIVLYKRTQFQNRPVYYNL